MTTLPRDQVKEGRVTTGIRGLDDILGGGLPDNHLYLLEGDPGTGKTTIALQFLLTGLQRAEKVLYITLSESQRELHDVARSHGWSLEGLPIFEMTPPEDDLSPEAQYTVFHPSEVELSDTIASILTQVDQVNPRRVVFDSLSELRMLARDPLRYRRQILALKRYFSGRHCTVLLLDDRTSEGNHLELQSIAHGVLMMQNLERDFGVKRRRIEVRKMRGCKFREGFHDYTIETGGVTIYPRMIAAEHVGDLPRHEVKSGLQELDDLLGGGLGTGTSALLMGPAGCGKSTIATKYALAAALRREVAVFFTFEEGRATLLHRSQGLGMDLEPHIQSGHLIIQQIDPAELSPGEFVSRVREYVDEKKVTVVVIDSLNGFLNAMPNEQFLSMQMHEMLSYLGHRGVATLITLAQHGFVGSGMISPVDVSYLADSVLLFRYYEHEGQVKQALSVVKKRDGYHERAIRELSFSEGMVHVGQPLTEFEGVLTGTPTYIGNGAKGRGRAGDA